MSLTILQQPASVLLSAGNDNIWTVSGNTLGAPNVFEYCYTADVYVNEKFATTLTAFPYLEFGFGVFNLRNILQSLVGYDFFPIDNNLIEQCPNSSAVINIKFGEEYISGNTSVIDKPEYTVPAIYRVPFINKDPILVSEEHTVAATYKSVPLFVSNKDVVSGNTAVVINSSLSFPDQVTTTLNDYLPITETTPFYLNDNPRLTDLTLEYASNLVFNIYTNQRMWLYLANNRYNLTGDAELLVGVVVFTFDINGNLLGDYQINNEYDTPTDVQAVGVGVPQLALWNADNATADMGDFPIITPDVAYYQVVAFWAGVSDSGTYEAATFKIRTDCGRFSDAAYTIHWLNTLGGFNSWLFNKKNETTQNKSVQKYKKQYGTLNADGSYSIKTTDQVNRPYFTVLQDAITMTTDFLSDSDVLYLKTLVSSPVVYMEDQNGLITAIEIRDDSYRINKKVNQKIYSLEMKINQSANDYRQTNN